jgi:hypothetical protein
VHCSPGHPTTLNVSTEHSQDNIGDHFNPEGEEVDGDARSSVSDQRRLFIWRDPFVSARSGEVGKIRAALLPKRVAALANESARSFHWRPV